MFLVFNETLVSFQSLFLVFNETLVSFQSLFLVFNETLVPFQPIEFSFYHRRFTFNQNVYLSIKDNNVLTIVLGQSNQSTKFNKQYILSGP